MKGAAGPGPSQYDKVYVQRFGSPKAKRVLVLVPGFLGGAGDFRLLANDIVKRVKGLQVWAYDRRTQAFEDTSVFETGDPAKALDYYLGFKYKKVNAKAVPYVGQWGLKLALEDLRRVVLKARAGGKRSVILGGHSLGASTTVAYASWDFHGRPGYKDIDGMVLIDGGLLGSFDEASLAEARTALAEIANGQVFDDLLGFGIPEITGILAELAALYARKQPDAVSPIQQSPLIPPQFKASFPVTNEAALGYAFDKDTSPQEFSLIRINAGKLAASGNPRPWQDGEITPIQRFATSFGSERPNAIEWYFPRRLRLDVDAMSPLKRTARHQAVGPAPVPRGAHQRAPLRVRDRSHERQVANGARKLVRRSRIRRARIYSDARQSHLDPLVAAPSRSSFLKTVVPFLKATRRK